MIYPISIAVLALWAIIGTVVFCGVGFSDGWEQTTQKQRTLFALACGPFLWLSLFCGEFFSVLCCLSRKALGINNWFVCREIGNMRHKKVCVSRTTHKYRNMNKGDS